MNELNTLNKHVRYMRDEFLELYKSITAKSVEISKNPLKILNIANEKVSTLYQDVITEKLFEFTDPIYQLFNITKQIADEVNNATTFSLLQYKKFGKYIKDHTDYEKLWFENAFGDLFEDTEDMIEPYWSSEKKICATYSFSAGFRTANQLYDDYRECAAREISKTDDGINKFLLNLTDFEKEIHEGLYLSAKKCIELRLKNDPVACLNALYKMDLGKLINKQEIHNKAEEARVTSVKRVNDCASEATKRSLDKIKKIYQQFVLCFVSEHKKKVTSIKGINKMALYLFEYGPQTLCPVTKTVIKSFKESTCSA